MDDYTSNILTTGQLMLGAGGKATGAIETSYDKDWFKITLQAGIPYEFTLGGRLSQQSGYEMLLLYDGSGRLLASKFDTSIFDGPRILFTPTAPGNYFLEVRDLFNATGIYEITASAAASGTIFGTFGNDALQGTSGNDTIDGLGGTDSVLFASPLSNYSVSKVGVGYQVAGAQGIDTLSDVERLIFSDKTINLTIKALAAATPAATLDRVEELYVAFFNRVPDADGLSFWVQQLNQGLSINSIAEAFYAAGVQFSSLTGFSASMSNDDFVNVVYRNVLGRTAGADAEGLAFWSAELASGRASKGSLVTAILDSAHTFKGDPTWGWVADLLDNKLAVADRFAVELGLNYNSSADSITHGMSIAAAVTPYDTSVALALIGVSNVSI